MSSPSPTAIFPTAATSNRVTEATTIRNQATNADNLAGSPVQMDNGDEARYSDKSGTYTKGLLQKSIGVVDPAAYRTFRTALDSGAPADFNLITLGGTRTLNGPQGGLAFNLECLDSSQFTSPPAPALASEEYATELVELYWASLLRDVAFTEYANSPTAIQAAGELSGMTKYAGPRNIQNKVTPDLLFRGGSQNLFKGETVGPYLSQFLLQSTTMGSLPIEQRYITNKAGIDYMLDADTFQQVQNGISTQLSLQPNGAHPFVHDGRGLAAYTHDDVLYQAYFMAYLVMNTLNVPLNPGNPYAGNKTQNGFGTFGQPDIAALLAGVASEALKAVWYQKWFVHLRHRPESGGAIVALSNSPQGGVQGQLHPAVLNSMAVQKSRQLNNSFFLSQAFPEGSPTHPAYPTGHGTVAGACITVLKFFFDGGFVLPSPMIPSSDGDVLNRYAGLDAGLITVNGELHKLAHNVSFGHGILAGIHWRSDTDTSIQLGEAVALSLLQDRANTYNEKFSVSLQKVDGSTATIAN